jgi:hypothetical protein
VTILLVHGFGAFAEHWRRNIPDLAARGYRCALSVNTWLLLCLEEDMAAELQRVQKQFSCLFSFHCLVLSHTCPISHFMHRCTTAVNTDFVTYYYHYSDKAEQNPSDLFPGFIY